jgi:enoyl-CoA hydratase/carnithine racemase
MSSTESLLLTDRRGRVCMLTLNRPDKKNALSLELVETATRKLEQLARRPRPRCW